MKSKLRDPVFTDEEMKTRPFLTPETHRFKTDKDSGRDIKLTCTEVDDGYYEYSVSVRGLGVPGTVRVWCDKFDDINLVASILLDARFP